MAKASLKPMFADLESEMIRTFLAGHHIYRPDLAYPQSHSDLQGGMRALMKRFTIVPRDIPLDWDEMRAERKEDQ